MNAPVSHHASHTKSYASQAQNDYAAATAAAALSQQHTPTASAQSNGRKRRASNVPGSRGVANLTPDQLSKKRANDREAQRAIRERTRNTIVGLEERIRELESQQPFQELQKVAQERDRALAECEELKRKLAAVANVVGAAAGQQQQQHQQPNLHGTFDIFDEFIDPTWLTEGDAELAALTAQQSPLPPLNTQPPPQQYSQPASGQYEQHQLHPDLRSPHSATTHTSPPDVSRAAAGSPYQPESTSLRRWSPSLDHPPNNQYHANGASFEQRQPRPASMQSHSNGERSMGLNFLLEPKQRTSASPPNTKQGRYTPQPTPEKPVYARLPNNCPPSCPLDSLLLDFLTNRQKQAAAGVPMHEVAGPEYPFYEALRDPSAIRSPKCHPLSALLLDILSKFPDIHALPERVAVLYIMFLVLRWMVCPCVPCYQKLPEWARPVEEQLDVPHPSWYEHVPWPIVRLRLTQTLDLNFENFFIPFCTKLSLNWPYPRDQVLIPAGDPDDPAAVKMNPVFETHARILENWSMGRIFKNDFPHLIDETVRIEDGDGSPG